jgi:hypothetical protein
MKRLAIAAIAVVFLAGAFAAAHRAPVGDLSADEIVARSVAARGGIDAWRKVETMVWTGHIESVHAPLPSMPFRMDQKRPNRTRLQIEAPGSRSVRAFDGTRGWKVRAAGGRPEVQPFTAQELTYAQAGHGIDGPLVDHAAKGNVVSLAGVDELGDRKAYHLKLRLAKGGDEDVWVDAETFLEVRHDRMAPGPAGAPRRVSATYGDYRAVEGLKVPFLIQTGGGPGATPDRMQIERVVLNAPLDDASFANPAAPRPRHRGLPGEAAPAPPAIAPTAASDAAGPGPR